MKRSLIHFEISLLALSTVLLVNCGSDSEQVTYSDSLTFDFVGMADGNPIEFNSKNYTTVSGNEISIDRMKVYISNIQLVNSMSGEIMAEEESYHLISLNDQRTQQSFTLQGIRSDFQFDQIKFAIGVDAQRNASIDNFGDLDATNDMAWDWNTGYKFFLMEGSFYPENSETKRGLILHIGLDKNYKSQEYMLSNLVDIPTNGTLQFELDALAPLNGPNVIDLNIKNEFMVDSDADKIAENYSNGLIKLLTKTF
ncbi:MAG: hypothetical protein JXQ96_19740 [Cyclobacteriaceae bacterium]